MVHALRIGRRILRIRIGMVAGGRIISLGKTRYVLTAALPLFTETLFCVQPLQPALRPSIQAQMLPGVGRRLAGGVCAAHGRFVGVGNKYELMGRRFSHELIKSCLRPPTGKGFRWLRMGKSGRVNDMAVCPEKRAISCLELRDARSDMWLLDRKT